MIKTAPLSNRRITSWLAPIAERERFVKTLTLVRIKIYIYIIWLTFYAAYSSNVPVKRMVAIVACQGVLNVNIRSPLKEEVRGGPKPHWKRPVQLLMPRYLLRELQCDLPQPLLKPRKCPHHSRMTMGDSRVKALATELRLCPPCPGLLVLLLVIWTMGQCSTTRLVPIF